MARGGTRARRAVAGVGWMVEAAPGGWGGALLATALGGGGAAETCLSAIVTAVSPSKGTCR